MPSFDEITEEDIYLLPKEELSAKYICIALYSGRFSLRVLRKILNSDPMQFYSKEFSFLIEHGYLVIQDDICRLTREGFQLYGAVGALFWSKAHQEKYIKSRMEESL